MTEQDWHAPESAPVDKYLLACWRTEGGDIFEVALKSTIVEGSWIAGDGSYVSDPDFWAEIVRPPVV